MWIAMTRIFGPMSFIFSISPARPTFKVIFSTIIERTSTPTRSGRHGCKRTQPRLLVIWGKYDLSFDSGEPERYRKDVPNAEVHVLDAGTFRARYQSGRNRGAR